LGVLWRWDNKPGEAGNSPRSWPAVSRLARASDRPTLIMLAHERGAMAEWSMAVV
jgi:hypothetical protein